MTTTQKISYLSTTPLQIGYRKKGRATCIAKTQKLEICSGDFICLLGPNGAGKSTLIRTLSGIQDPLKGTVRLNNQPYDTFSPRERARKISVVLTEMPSLGMLDAYSLVALGRHPYSGKFGALGHKDKERIHWALQAVDALKFKNCQISYLSDGERQKLLIARALAQETPLILLDEPTVFLDLPRQIELMVTLRKLAHQEQMGIILSTHNLDLAMRFADYIWLLNKNGTMTTGYPEVLATNGTISSTFSSREVEWNIEKGIFRIRANPNIKAIVKGDGALAIWTQRALERLGFMIVNKQESPMLEVTVSEIDQKCKWSVSFGNYKDSFSSIETMIHWLTRETTQTLVNG